MLHPPEICFFSAYLIFTLGSSHLFKYHAFIFTKYSFMITAKLQLKQLIVNSLVLLHIICIVCRVVSWSITFMLRLVQGLFFMWVGLLRWNYWSLWIAIVQDNPGMVTYHMNSVSLVKKWSLYCILLVFQINRVHVLHFSWESCSFS